MTIKTNSYYNKIQMSGIIKAAEGTCYDIYNSSANNYLTGASGTSFYYSPGDSRDNRFEMVYLGSAYSGDQIYTPTAVNWLLTNETTGSNIQALYSFDGDNQYSNESVSGLNSGSNYKLYDSAYGTSDGTNSLWVASMQKLTLPTTYSASLVYSSNGIEWSDSTGVTFGSGSDGFGYGVAYGTSNGSDILWAATGKPDNLTSDPSIIYSENGKEWQESTGANFGTTNTPQGRAIAYGTSNGTSAMWVAVGQPGNAASDPSIIYSENGKEWTNSSGDNFNNGSGLAVAYGTSNGTSAMWAAGGNTSDQFLYSENGKVWSTGSGASFGNSGQCNQIAYGTSDGTNPMWVAAGGGTNSSNKLLFSENGKVWQIANGVCFPASTIFGGAVAYGQDGSGNNIWVAYPDIYNSSNNTNVLNYSTNGKDWQSTTAPITSSQDGLSITSLNSSFPNPALS